MRNLSFLLFPLLLVGCPKKGPVASGQATDPLPVILASLGSGATVADLSGDFALEKGDFPGCLAGYSIAAAMTTASEGILGNIDGAALPSVDVDVNACLLISEQGVPDGADVPSLIQPVIEALLAGASTVIQAYSSQLDCEAREWSLAAIEYVGGVAPAVIAEIDSPDGIIAFDRAVVNLEACEED